PLYISDSVHNRIRKVDKAGIITTWAGRGRGFGGDGGPAAQALLADPKTLSMDPHDNLFFVDLGNHRVRRITPAGVISTVAGNGSPTFAGDGGPALNASLNQPKGVWVTPGGDIYIADTRNHRVRHVDPSGVITTVAGTGVAGSGGDGGPGVAAQLNEPRGVAVDSAGNVYIGEELGQRVRKVDRSGTITTVVGRAPAATAATAVR